MARLSPGDKFPGVEVESTEGPVALAERWERGPLVVALMRHFG